MPSSVTYDNSARTTVGGTVTAVAVCNFTIAANACLVVAILNNNTTDMSAVAANSVPMTLLGKVINTALGLTGHLYVLTAAPSGNVSISANLVGGITGSMCIGGASYLKTKTTGSGPFGTLHTGTAGAVATFVISVSTSTTDRVVLFGCGNNNFTATNATTRMTDTAHYAFRYADTAGPGNAISLSASCVVTVQNLAFFGLNLIASVDAVASYSSLMGVGR